MYEKDKPLPGWAQPLYGSKTIKNGIPPSELFKDNSNKQVDINSADTTLPKTFADALGDLDPKTASRAALAAIYTLRGAKALTKKVKEFWQKHRKKPDQQKPESETNPFQPFTEADKCEIVVEPSPLPFLINSLLEKYAIGEVTLLNEDQIALTDAQTKFLNKLAAQQIYTGKLRKLPHDKLNEIMKEIDYRIDELQINPWTPKTTKVVVSANSPPPPPVKIKSLSLGGLGNFDANNVWRPLGWEF